MFTTLNMFTKQYITQCIIIFQLLLTEDVIVSKWILYEVNLTSLQANNFYVHKYKPKQDLFNQFIIKHSLW